MDNSSQDLSVAEPTTVDAISPAWRLHVRRRKTFGLMLLGEHGASGILAWGTSS
jgi:hypothetical protein